MRDRGLELGLWKRYTVSLLTVSASCGRCRERVHVGADVRNDRGLLVEERKLKARGLIVCEVLRVVVRRRPSHTMSDA
jgi:hypothetical protein